MRLTALEIVSRARSLAGVKFRPQGRDPATGLDCVGVLLWTFGIASELVRRNYRVRGAHRSEIEQTIQRWFAPIECDQLRPGDVALFTIAASQSHLAISCGSSLIHADASLRKVVETPMPGGWALTRAFRSQSIRQPD
jgi:cell wall-associated NlpC family hydrolase